jgi:hypothetical protein
MRASSYASSNIIPPYYNVRRVCCIFKALYLHSRGSKTFIASATALKRLMNVASPSTRKIEVNRFDKVQLMNKIFVKLSPAIKCAAYI